MVLGKSDPDKRCVAERADESDLFLSQMNIYIITVGYLVR